MRSRPILLATSWHPTLPVIPQANKLTPKILTPLPNKLISPAASRKDDRTQQNPDIIAILCSDAVKGLDSLGTPDSTLGFATVRSTVLLQKLTALASPFQYHAQLLTTNIQAIQ